MGIFSIKDIEAVSGIKCHTLRIWEQRYGIIQPKRTDTNIRYYDDDDLKYIINISILNNQGYKISEIAKMDREQVNEAILQSARRHSEFDMQVKALVSAMLSFDEYEFHKVLTTTVIQAGFEKAMTDMVFPFLNEVGILWQIGSIHPSHEHFATNIIKQKLYVAIDGQVGKRAKHAKHFLLFLPENEQHCIGLLFASYILRARGHDVLYLGQEVPLVDLMDACVHQVPDYIFTIMMSGLVDCNKQKFLNQLSGYWPSSRLLVAGIQFMNCELCFPENVTLIRKLPEFITFVDNLAQPVPVLTS